MIQVLSIIGATASGKTDLSIKLAQKFNGEIISCDSVQIYKYFDIISAKPTKKELSTIPHHLIDFLEPNSHCSAGLWKKYAIQAVEDISKRGKTPIIVGGTGLYLKALYQGMFEKESRDQKYREDLQNIAKKGGLEALYERLTLIDEEYARKISKNDEMRIIRALEVFKVTNIKFSELHKHNVKPNWEWTFTKPILEREIIYQNIENRIYKMYEEGMIQEVELLLRRFGKDVPPMSTIGYRHVCEYLEGIADKDTMLKKLILDTRHFAKRQETLFRSLIPDTQLINPNILIDKGINNG